MPKSDSQNEYSVRLRVRGQARAVVAVLPPSSGAGGSGAGGGLSGLADEAGEVEGASEDVGQDGSFSGVGLAEPRGALHAPAGLVGVAALGIALAAETQFPGGGANLQVASQADVTIGQGKVHDHETTQGMLRVAVRTVGRVVRCLGCGIGRRVEGDVGLGAVTTALAAEPFAVPALVIVTVEREPVAVQTERVSLGVVAALQTGERILVFGVAAGDNSPQGLQVVVDKAQDLVKALTGIGDDFADVEVRKTALQVLQARDGLEMVVAVRGDEGRDRRAAVGEEAVVYDVESLGFVAKAVRAFALLVTVLLGVPRGGGIGRRGRLIGARVVDIGGFRIAGSDEATVVGTSIGVAGTACLVRLASGTGALGGGQEAVSVLMTAAHTRASQYQLAVGRDADPALGPVTGEGRSGGDEAVGHQTQGQTVGALLHPSCVSVAQSHAKGGLSGQIRGVETQPTAVAAATLGRMKFGQQAGPTPVTPAGQEESQAQTDGVERRRTEMTGAALGQEAPPRAEVEQTQDQVNIIKPTQSSVD